MFCDAIAEIEESMADGTMTPKPMNFSTMPTAAASYSPRPLAMMVMAMKATWMKPSCMAIGTPIFKMSVMVCR